MPFAGPLALALAMQTPAPNRPRFDAFTPLPGLLPATLDVNSAGTGVANLLAKARDAQARILWVDATANLDRYNTEEKIVALVRRIAETGFNTIVFDVKPISGQVVYRSRYAPKLTEWRGKTMPTEFDPLPIMVREAHARRLTIFAALNAFSEGHRNFLVGPGYAWPDRQTVLYEGQPVLSAPDGGSVPLGPKMDVLAPDAVSVLTRTDLLPPRSAEAPPSFALTVRANGSVVDGFEDPDPAEPPTIPVRGTLLYGTGPGADFLRRVAEPGSRLTYDSLPLYVPISQRPEQQIPLMMNPNHPDVRAYALNIAEEIVRGYDVDGIVYDDRLRYAGMNADFSELTRSLFESEVGRRLNWPDDVFRWTVNPNLVRGLRPGPYYDRWMAWRASRLRGFVDDVRARLKTVRPNLELGVYAGSWYGEYPALGNNWASPAAEAGFWFQTPDYRQAGLAPALDFLITGCYYPTPTIYDALGRGTGIGATIESAAVLSNRLVQDQTWTYAGLMLSDYKNDPDGLAAALQTACGTTQGVMVFDLSHDFEASQPVFARAFGIPKRSPHDDPSLLSELRKRRRALDESGRREPPIIISAGSSGTGQ